MNTLPILTSKATRPSNGDLVELTHQLISAIEQCGESNRLTDVMTLASNLLEYLKKPEVKEEPEQTADIKLEDLHISTHRSAGQGSWSVRPDSAVTIVHLPTGTSVTCDVEMSPHRNKVIALEKLIELVNKGKTVKQDDLRLKELFEAQLDEDRVSYQHMPIGHVEDYFPVHIQYAWRCFKKGYEQGRKDTHQAVKRACL